MAVGLGFSSSFGMSSKVEIIDIENPSNVCSQLQNYPLAIESAMGSLNSDGKPLICGGCTSTTTLCSTCYTYENDTWIMFTPMNFERCTGVLSTGNWFNEKRRILVTGTSGASGATSEMLTDNVWEMFNILLPYNFTYHCSVMVNSSTSLIIGGRLNGITSNKTFFFNIDEKYLLQGPSMNIVRYYYSCGKILINDSYLIIAVGGMDDKSTFLKSVEILDDKSNSWKFGPSLPYGITRASIVEDPRGGIVLVAGRTSAAYLSSMLRLPNANFGMLIVYFCSHSQRLSFNPFQPHSSLPNP